jgi:hypothetical protein
MVGTSQKQDARTNAAAQARNGLMVDDETVKGVRRDVAEASARTTCPETA